MRAGPPGVAARVWLLVALLALIAALGAAISHALQPQAPPLSLARLVPLVLLGILGGQLRERDIGAHLSVSLTTVVLAASLPLVGPWGVVLVGLLSYLLAGHQSSLRTRLFNACMTAAMGAVGSLVYAAVGGGRVGVTDEGSVAALLLRVGLPLLVAYVAMTVINLLAYGAMSAIVRGTRLLSVSWQTARQLGLGYLGHVVVAFLFAVLWGPAGLGALSSVFVLGPLLAAHWSIGRGVVAGRAHLETVSTFVAALEQADPRTVGHSVRVSALCEAIAPHLDIEGQEADALRYAALLHDIGLVAVRADLPSDPGERVAYLNVVSGHPEAGVEMLSDLDFLRPALPGIAHHHERWDGRGYPAGLAAEQIPLAARVIAAADAYDSLRTGPAPLGREDALARLQERAGRHLDPAVVEALRLALRRGAATPDPYDSIEPLPVDPGAVTARYRDHDDPALSDAFAEWQPEPAGDPR